MSKTAQMEEIVAAERLARSILEQAAEAIVVCDRDGRIIRASKAAEQLCGKNPMRQPFLTAFPLEPASVELRGDTGLPPASKSAEEIGWEKFRASALRRAEMQLRREDGVVFDLLVSCGVLTGAEDQPIGSVVCLTDITERKRAECVMLENVLRAQAMAIVLNTIAAGSPADEAVLSGVARQIGKLIGDGCAIRLLSRDRRALEAAGVYHHDPEAQGLLNEITSRPQTVDEGLSCSLLETGQAVLLPAICPEESRASISAVYRPYAGRFGVGGMVLAPLRGSGRVLGTLVVLRDRGKPPFTIDEQMFIQEVADHVGLAIVNARLFQEVQNHAAKLEGCVAERTVALIETEQKLRSLNAELERRVADRTAELEAVNRDLEGFTHSVAHDLRAPLRQVGDFAALLAAELGAQLGQDARHYLDQVQEGVRRMGALLHDLLGLARVGRRDVELQLSGLDSIVAEVVAELEPETAQRAIEWRIGCLPFAECDRGLIKIVFANLLSNAVKFTRPRPTAVIEVGQARVNGRTAIFVRDNGVGFNMKRAGKLFGVFQRLHRFEDFEGSGVGLATVQRIVQKHGGRVWAESEVNKGTSFYFILGTTEAGGSQDHTAAAGRDT